MHFTLNLQKVKYKEHIKDGPVNMPNQKITLPRTGLSLKKKN